MDLRERRRLFLLNGTIWYDVDSPKSFKPFVLLWGVLLEHVARTVRYFVKHGFLFQPRPFFRINARFLIFQETTKKNKKKKQTGIDIQESMYEVSFSCIYIYI